MDKKIIFLDVDGVINTINQDFNNGIPFDINALNNLKFLVDQTDSYIVITSEYRHNIKQLRQVYDALDSVGLGQRLIGKTKRIETKNGNATYADRGLEIENYLSSNDCDNFVIIDDIKWDLERFEDKLIWTHCDKGLTEDDVYLAVNILNNKSLHR